MYYWFKAVVKCGYKGNANFWNCNKKNENNDEKNIFRNGIVFFGGVSCRNMQKREGNNGFWARRTDYVENFQ